MKPKPKKDGEVLFGPERSAEFRRLLHPDKEEPEHPLAESFARWKAASRGYLPPETTVIVIVVQGGRPPRGNSSRDWGSWKIGHSS